MITERQTARPPCGALRSTRLPMPRFTRSRPSGWPSSSRCSVCCRRCGSSGALGRSAGRSTGCRVSGSARPATRVPCRLIGHQVTITTTDQLIMIIEPITGEVLAEHQLVAPGGVSIVDAHYGGRRPDRPSRAPRARTQTEKDFLALGPIAEAFLVGAAAAGVSKLSSELADIATLHAAHGTDALLAALRRAVEFRRWRAADVRSILAAGGTAPTPRPAGQGLVLTLPSVPTRSLDAYKINTE